MFGRSSTSGENQTAYQHKRIIPTVKHGGGGLMIWADFSATGPGHQSVTINVCFCCFFFFLNFKM